MATGWGVRQLADCDSLQPFLGPRDPPQLVWLIFLSFNHPTDHSTHNPSRNYDFSTCKKVRAADVPAASSTVSHPTKTLSFLHFHPHRPVILMRSCPLQATRWRRSTSSCHHRAQGLQPCGSPVLLPPQKPVSCTGHTNSQAISIVFSVLNGLGGARNAFVYCQITSGTFLYCFACHAPSHPNFMRVCLALCRPWFASSSRNFDFQHRVYVCHRQAVSCRPAHASCQTQASACWYALPSHFISGWLPCVVRDCVRLVWIGELNRRFYTFSMSMGNIISSRAALHYVQLSGKTCTRHMHNYDHSVWLLVAMCWQETCWSKPLQQPSSAACFPFNFTRCASSSGVADLQRLAEPNLSGSPKIMNEQINLTWWTLNETLHSVPAIWPCGHWSQNRHQIQTLHRRKFCLAGCGVGEESVCWDWFAWGQCPLYTVRMPTSGSRLPQCQVVLYMSKPCLPVKFKLRGVALTNVSAHAFKM